MPVKEFIGERCTRSSKGREAVLILWEAYVGFCKERQLQPAAPPQEFLARAAVQGRPALRCRGAALGGEQTQRVGGESALCSPTGLPPAQASIWGRNAVGCSIAVGLILNPATFSPWTFKPIARRACRNSVGSNVVLPEHQRR